MAKWKAWFADVRDRLWYLPAILTAAAIALALLTLELDRRYLEEQPVGGGLGLVFGGGVEGARGVLSAIAGGIITVTGIVFSITIVTLRLAAQQFTPRILREFTSDRGSQATLGVFTATFVYALLVLRGVRSAGEPDGPFVPALSVTIALGLALISIGFLIFFISHIATEIQAAAAIDRVMRGLLSRIDHLFPESVGRGRGRTTVEMPVPAEAPAVVSAEGAGYVQTVDDEALFSRADGGLLIRMEAGVGAFVVPDTPLVSVWPAAAVDAELGEALRQAFVLGRERTPHQDVEFGFIELADIAVKALSPGVADPTTATICIDRLSEALVALGRREFPPGVRTGRDGRICVIARHTDFERVVTLSIDPIRRYADADAGVLRRLLEALDRVAERVPEERREPLREHAAAVVRLAERTLREPRDLKRVRAAAEWLRRGADVGGAAAA